MLFTGRCYRTLSQLVIEWLLGFFGVLFLFFGLVSLPSSIPGLAIGAAMLYMLFRIRDGWSRKPVKVYSDGSITLGKELFGRNMIKSVTVVSEHLEPGLIIGQSVLSYELVTELQLDLVDGSRRRLRLKSGDSSAFLNALEKTNMG